MPHIVASAIEHDAVERHLQHLEAQQRADVSRVPCPGGVVSIDQLVSMLTPNTCLVSVMLANNESGSIQPVSAVSKAVRAWARDNNVDIAIHSDVAQALGKIPVSAEQLGVDFLTIVG